MTDGRLSDEVVTIVRFCAVECEMQQSGERSVGWMVEAWQYAQRMTLPFTAPDVVALGRLVEPAKNARGFRRTGVRVGWDVKPDWSVVPHQMDNLIDAQDRLSPAEWFREYEEVHPFVDGNGRTGQILFNALAGSLNAPEWAPNFWSDPRRVSGDGAPAAVGETTPPADNGDDETRRADG